MRPCPEVAVIDFISLNQLQVLRESAHNSVSFLLRRR
jgi:hypothetical protein